MVLGIDPGIERCGWGIVTYEQQDPRWVSHGLISTPRSLNLPERLLRLHEQIGDIICRYKPDVMAIEKLYFCNNAKTAIDVGQARGIVLLAAAQNRLAVEELTPLQVKSYVVGYGGATKDQVGLMVKSILGLSEVPSPDDVADALAIAIAGAVRRSASKMLGDIPEV